MKYVGVLTLFPPFRDIHVIGSDNGFTNTYSASNKVTARGVCVCVCVVGLIEVSILRSFVLKYGGLEFVIKGWIQEKACV